jgi:hypothetical protein
MPPAKASVATRGRTTSLRLSFSSSCATEKPRGSPEFLPRWVGSSTQAEATDVKSPG